MIRLICNSKFPSGMVVLNKRLYKKFMGNLKFNSKCIFLNNNLPLKTAIVSTDVFKDLTEKGEIVWN